MLKKVKDTLFSWIFSSEEQEELLTPIDAKEKFVLKYKNTPIGYLKVEDGVWVFMYSDLFKMQHHLDVLVDFPDKDKVYQSHHLWPFFSHRIPGLGQPSVREIIQKEHLDKKNEAGLLKRFGQFSITNPFELAIV